MPIASEILPASLRLVWPTIGKWSGSRVRADPMTPRFNESDEGWRE